MLVVRYIYGHRCRHCRRCFFFVFNLNEAYKRVGKRRQTWYRDSYVSLQPESKYCKIVGKTMNNGNRIQLWPQSNYGLVVNLSILKNTEKFDWLISNSVRLLVNNLRSVFLLRPQKCLHNFIIEDHLPHHFPCVAICEERVRTVNSRTKTIRF